MLWQSVRTPMKNSVFLRSTFLALLAAVTTQRDSLLWTLEEISHLVSHSGHPEETLGNIVQLIQRTFDTDVCSVYLLEPDRVDAGAGRDGRAAPRQRRTRAHAIVGRAWPVWSASSCGRKSWRMPRRIRGSSISARPAKTRTTRSLASRSSIKRIAAGRAGRPDDRAARVQRATPSACSRWPARSSPRSSSQARTLGQFVAPAHQTARSARAEHVVELGSRYRQPVPGARSRRCGASSITTPSPCFSRFRSRDSKSARRRSLLHSRINYAYRRMQEHLTSTRTWGARNAGVLWARPVAYFSAEFGLHESVPIYSGGLGILAGDHIKAASDLGIPLVGIGLYYGQGYFTQRFDLTGYQQEDYRDVDSSLLPLEPAKDAKRQPVTVEHRHAHRHDRRARLEARRRPKHASAARFRRRRQSARKIAASPRGSTAATIAFASARSCCSASAGSRR